MQHTIYAVSEKKQPAVFCKQSVAYRGGGLEPLPLAYNLRNKRVRVRQNVVGPIFNKKYENFSGEKILPP